MDANEFRERGAEVVDYIVDYYESISERRVNPDVKPGYLQPLLPSSAPETGESFEKIMEDVEKYIMPGLVHWHHPRFHAYFPAMCSYPSILGEMIADSIGSAFFNYSISRSEHELEVILLDWYGKMIGLPDKFLYYSSDSIGGGFLRNSSSECVFLSLIAARKNVLKRLKRKNPSLNESMMLPSLVAYCSMESHSCAEKAALMALVTIRVLDTDENYSLRGETLAKAVEEDKKQGLIPFYASIIVGATSCCSCDPIYEIGPVCEENEMWLNVDAAYAGSFSICPEYKHILEGIEYASSLVINPGKTIMINLDGSIIWTTDYLKINDALLYDDTLLSYDLKTHWNRSCSTRCRAFKLWFVIRNYGIDGLQKHYRNYVRLAKMFENYVRSDDRFELLTSHFGLVCFRLKASNLLNKKLLMSINASSKLHLTACMLKKKYVIRFCVCSKEAKEEDITYAWSVFCDFSNELLETEHQ